MKRLLTATVALCIMFAMVAGNSAAGEKGRKQSGEKFVIGYSYPTINNEFWADSLRNFQDAAKAVGFDILEITCNNDQAKQINDVESMLATGIDGLVLAPQDASVCPGIVFGCKQRGVPVIIIDRWPGDEPVPGKDYIAFMGPNDTEAGYGIAKSLIDAGCKKLVGIGGFQSTSVGEGRKAGLDKALAEHPEVKLLQYEWAGESWDDGDRVFRSMLSAHRDMDGVWGYNDSLALSAVNVLKESGMIGKVKVGGMDLLAPAIDSMINGELWFSTGGHYMQTAFGAIVLFDVLNGIKYEGEPVTKLSLMEISQDKVAKFKKDFLDNPTAVDWKSYSRVYNPSGKIEFKVNF